MEEVRNGICQIFFFVFEYKNYLGLKKKGHLLVFKLV